VPHGARLPQRERKKKERHTASYSYNYRYSLYGTIWDINRVTIIFAAGEKKKITDNGVPEEVKEAHTEREQKLETPLQCSVFFLNIKVFRRRGLANYRF
jgi:hypothetical protein